MTKIIVSKIEGNGNKGVVPLCTKSMCFLNKDISTKECHCSIDDLLSKAFGGWKPRVLLRLPLRWRVRTYHELATVKGHNNEKRY